MDMIIKGKEHADAFGTYSSQVERYELVNHTNKKKNHTPDRLEASIYPIICSWSMLTCIDQNLHQVKEAGKFRYDER